MLRLTRVSAEVGVGSVSAKVEVLIPRLELLPSFPRGKNNKLEKVEVAVVDQCLEAHKFCGLRQAVTASVQRH